MENKTTPCKKSPCGMLTPLVLLATMLLPQMLFAQVAESKKMTSEASKIEVIKSIMAKQEFVISPFIRDINKLFCEGFLQEFRQQENIEFIEPVAKADSYDDPVWQPYKARCPGVELFDSYKCMAADADYIASFPKAEGDRYLKSVCEHYRGTANFKLYRVDINNNPKDGEEQVFYYERAQGPLNYPDKKVGYGNGGYTEIDLDRCERKGGASVNDPYSYFYKRPLENYNGIIKYKGRHFIFDLYELDGSDRDPQQPDYRLHLNGYFNIGKEAKPRLGPVCSYSTIVLKRK